MIIFPAIDIQDGKVVRLMQGKFDQVTEYGQDPVATAKHWVKQGATWLHVVDLDGAKSGTLKNTDMVLQICQAVEALVQTGGGIRSQDDVNKLINGGVKRVVLGTRVIEDRAFLKTVLQRWPDNIAVSLDCKNGFVTQRGWTSVTNIKAINMAAELKKAGLRCLIYTDISRDGMMTGPNLAGLKEILTAGIPTIASGGVSGIKDIENLMKLENAGLIGAITGKAIYEGTLDLSKAIERCSLKG